MGFLGHIVRNGGLDMEPDKLGTITQAPRPQNRKQVRSFMGLAGYYHKFIPNFVTIAVPLMDLTKYGQSNMVRWGSLKRELLLCSTRSLLRPHPKVTRPRKAVYTAN